MEKMSHDIINKLVTIGQIVLNQILSKIKGQNPQWYALIADEVTDVNYTEQLNVSIRYVDDDYIILLCCAQPLSLCHGQAYDGAAVMKGIRSGVATRIKDDIPQALPVHCLAHSQTYAGFSEML